MKFLYKSLLFLMIFICSVGSVCATDTDNINADLDNSLSDVNSNSKIVEDVEISSIDCSDNLNNNDYCCGAVAFQSALKANDINITLEESNKAIHSVNDTTSMQGIIDGAKAYNLTAYPVKINVSDLQSNFIVHMNVNGTGHWCVIGDIINNSNVSNQNLVLDIDEFNKYYDNNAIIITKDSNLNIDKLSATLLSSLECEKITGDGKLKPIINIVNKVYRWLKKHPIIPIGDVNITVKL